MRLYEPFLRKRDFVMEVERGLVVSAELGDYMVLYYFVRGVHHEPAFELSRKLISSGATVVDVGANIGLWTLGAAQIAGPSGRVHAFEPNPSTYKRLCSNIRLNGLDFVQPHRLCVSSEHGQRTLYAVAANSGLASLARREGATAVGSMETVSLDEFLSKQGIEHIDFLKVDVEGAEFLVFAGAERFLRHVHGPMICFEVGDSLAEAMATSSTRAKELLEDCGYLLFRFKHGTLLRVNRAEAHQVSEDLFAFKDHHLKRPAVQVLLGKSDGAAPNVMTQHCTTCRRRSS